MTTEEQARAFVDRLIGPNEVTEENKEAYLDAIEVVGGCFDSYGSDELGSFSIGGFSMSGGMDGKAAAKRAALDILVPAGLAFMGV